MLAEKLPSDGFFLWSACSSLLMLSPCTKRRHQVNSGMIVMGLRVIDSLVLRNDPLILLLGRLCIGSLYQCREPITGWT
jgi:hypothetical protein